MSGLSLGRLYKKKNIIYQGKQYEIFEYIDYAAGITFTNTENNNRCNIVSGRYAGKYASIINKNANDEELVFICENTEKAIEDNDNCVEFLNIREKRISGGSRYFFREQNSTSLKGISDKKLIDFLERNELGFSKINTEQQTNITAIYSYIKNSIIAQDEQVMKILTTLFKNQKVINSDLDIKLIKKLKENLMIYGSKGTGKSEILNIIAKLYNIPIVTVDTTSLSEGGFSGRKITDILNDLYISSGKNIELAEKGILIIKQFDKIAENENSNFLYSSKNELQSILSKLLDGSSFYFNDIEFDTTKLTIVCIGTFEKIANKKNYNLLTDKDFIEYGISPELISKFSKIIAMNSLSKEDIINIIKNSNLSPLSAYKQFFEIQGIDFNYSEDFIDYIADLVITKNFGAGGIKSVLDSCISSALFEIFTGEFSGINLIKPKNTDEKPYILTKEKTTKALKKIKNVLFPKK